MTAPLHEPDDFAILGMNIGEVIDVNDPKGIGRVRVTIPGLVEQSSWARPLGTLIGFTPQRGGFFVPNVGATVAVWFHHGDIDSPYYLAGAPGAAVPNVGEEVPAFVKNEPKEDRPKLRVIETDFFVIAIDDRPVAADANGVPDLDANLASPRQRLVIQFKGTPDTPSEDGENMIEIDGATRGITVHGVAGVRLASTGIIELDANQIQFRTQGVLRRVGAVEKDI